jgi:hypothetical protein
MEENAQEEWYQYILNGFYCPKCGALCAVYADGSVDSCNCPPAPAVATEEPPVAAEEPPVAGEASGK